MKWGSTRRPDPKPAREQDVGRFEISKRDGQARIGQLHTKHGVIETPCLLPVINPNIRTIEPREMYDKYGIQALITNSYVIWKHEHLKSTALENGIHELLDFPGAIMTDSGTFQSYVYGDVEVGVEEIVEFQRNIGVDIATMLDVFTRPDMNFEEVSEAVEETIKRAEVSLNVAGDTLLNGPIQGGIFPQLRSKSASEMSALDFCVYPLGGIVPIMEKQKYKDLAKIMLVCKSRLAPNKPVHMFGCGHPMLFPMLIAMGADLFDSAAYALFARDGRLLTPWGTEKIDEIEEWPLFMPSVVDCTPNEVREMNKIDRTAILSRFNLEVTLQELAHCRQAVRNGTIWRLVERRSHQHPALREAFLWLVTEPAQTNMDPIFIDEISSSMERGEGRGRWEENWDWLINAQITPRNGSEQWAGQDTIKRPHVEMARRRLFARWRSQKKGDVVIFHGTSAPWRTRIGELMDRLVETDFEFFLHTPLGLLPLGLEDLNPWAHIEGPEWIWNRKPDLSWCRQELERFNIDNRKIITIDISNTEDIHKRVFSELDIGIQEANQNLRFQQQITDKLCVLGNVSLDDAIAITEGSTFVKSRTGRIRNMISKDGNHLFSPRLAEGGISLTLDGAIWAHSIRKSPMPDSFTEMDLISNVGEGFAVVVVNNDAEPFVKEGRNVMHGFILGCDSWTRPSENVLVVNSQGELLAFGRSQATAKEMEVMKKGIAVKVRQGCP
ncbi:MAG: tRNA guanosine(15) transglycosylase TgtA [Candidatus Poseidoniaceae archaeon]|jgi:7-cyano-7-deazaguanine tRNA-ribosyltransferase|nr:tRNA guanosine(15) transglycosylase TgtA [Candidatus Poseidoniaceae archaeon]